MFVVITGYVNKIYGEKCVTHVINQTANQIWLDRIGGEGREKPFEMMRNELSAGKWEKIKNERAKKYLDSRQ